MRKYFLNNIILLMLLFGTSCSHLASNNRACETAPPLIPLPYSFIGNVFQVGPCASIEPLRIETGVELEQIRGGVVRAIEENRINNWLEIFARNMGCDNSYLNQFLIIQIENKDKIWGKEFENSNRTVVRNLREYTLKDKELKKGCW